MGIWINIIDNKELANIQNYVVKENRFQIDENKAVYYHLTSMYDEFVRVSGKIIVTGEEIIEGKEIERLISLLKIQKARLKKIFLDEWEFQINPKIVKSVNNEKYNPNNFDSTKAFLAEKSIEASLYEIRKARLGLLKLEINKEWISITKSELEIHIDEYINILSIAFLENNHIYFSYY